MPSSATITAFYSFTADTKARASHLNTNFGNFRGHLMPIHTETNTSSDQTYDLGSSSYRWRTLFSANIDVNISNTASQVLSGTTAGGFKFTKSGTTTFEVEDNIVSGLKSPMNMTTVAAAGHLAASAAINFNASAAGHIAGSTCTITTLGRPVFIGLMPVGDTTGNSGLRLVSTDLTFATTLLYAINYLRNGSTVCSKTIHFTSPAPSQFNYPAGVFGFYDTPAAGTYKYSIYSDQFLGTNWSGSIQNVRLFALEV